MTGTPALLQGLAENGALLLALTFLYGLVRPRVGRLPRAARAPVTGALFGAIAVLGMLDPIRVAPGVLVDARAVVVMLAGAFAGQGAGLTAGAAVIAYRAWLGGVGTLPGVGAVLTAVWLGAWAGRRFGRVHGAGRLFGLGVALTAAALAWMSLIPDPAVATSVLRRMVLPVGVIFPLDTLALGLLLSYVHGEHGRLALTQFAVDHSTEANLRIAPSGHVEAANAAAGRLLGYAPDELRALSLWDVDQGCPEATWPAVWDRVRRGDLGVFESTFSTKAGAPVPVEVAATFLAFEGEEWLCLFVRDVSRRRRAETTARALVDVDRELALSLDPVRVAKRVAAAVLQLLRVRAAAVARLDPASGALVYVAGAGEVDAASWRSGTVPAGQGVIGRAIATRGPVQSPDILADPTLDLPEWVSALVRRDGLRAAAAAPLVAHGRTLGALLLRDAPGRRFGEDELALLSTFADRAALAVRNAQLYETSQRGRAEADRLAALWRLLGSSLDVREVGARVVGSLRGLLGPGPVGLYRLEAESGALVSVAVVDETGAAQAPRAYPPGTGLVGCAARDGRTLRSPDVLADPRVTLGPDIPPPVGGPAFGSILAVPLRARGDVVGALAVGRPTGRAFEADEVSLAEAFADQAAAALDNAWLHDETRARLRETETLLAVAGALAETRPAEDGLRRAAREAARTFGADMAGVYALDPETDALVPVAGHHVPEALRGTLLETPFPMGRFPFLREAWATGQPVWTADYATDPRFDQGFLAAFRPRALLFAPTHAGGEPIEGGLFLAWWHAARTFDPRELALVEGVGRLIGQSLRRARAERALQASEARIRAIVETTDEVIYRVPAGRGNPSRGRPEFVSAQAERLTGRPADAFRRDPGLWGRLVHPRDVAGVEAATRRLLRTREPVTRLYRFRCGPGGEYRWMEDRVVPILDAHGEVAAIQGAVRDVTDRQRDEALRQALHEKLRRAHERLRQLSGRLLDVQEAERRHLARELHDEVGQILTALKLGLEVAMLDPGRALPALDDARRLVNDLIARVRDLSLSLRPSILDDLGLVPALLWQTERFGEQTGVRVAFCHAEVEGRRFVPEVETAVYRIVQEALTNVARHARVPEASVRLRVDGRGLLAEVEDRGAGFEPAAALARTDRGGLAGMRERAELLGGLLTVESAPGGGTRVTARLPLTRDGGEP